MYKQCKTEVSADRQRQMEQGLLELMKIKRYDQISVSNLCEFLDVPRKSFYRYFSGKEGALNALLYHTVLDYEMFSAAYSSGRTRNLQLDLICYFAFWKTQKSLLDALSYNNMIGSMVEKMIQYATTDGFISVQLLTQEIVHFQKEIHLFLTAGMTSLMLMWHRGGYKESPEQMAEIVAAFISKPIFQDMDSVL